MRLTPEEIALKAEEIRTLGFTVLEDAIPLSMVEAMRERSDALLAEKIASEPFNRGANRHQMFLPWEAPFTEPILYENEDALAILEAVMGPDLALVYFASDTPLPGSEHQRVHPDTRLLFPETQISLPCYAAVLNLPLVDCTVENGSLEFWPGGTHLFAHRPVDLERLAAALPSARANLKAGSLLLRDARMWHRGTPNRSDRSRPHVALVYTRPWYRFEQPTPALTRPAFDALTDRARRLLRYATIID